jgi:hypothetical protein
VQLALKGLPEPKHKWSAYCSAYPREAAVSKWIVTKFVFRISIWSMRGESAARALMAASSAKIKQHCIGKTIRFSQLTRDATELPNNKRSLRVSWFRKNCIFKLPISAYLLRGR